MREECTGIAINLEVSAESLPADYSENDDINARKTSIRKVINDHEADDLVAS